MTLGITTTLYKIIPLKRPVIKSSTLPLCTRTYFTSPVMSVYCFLIPIQPLNSADTIPGIFIKRTCF